MYSYLDYAGVGEAPIDDTIRRHDYGDNEQTIVDHTNHEIGLLEGVGAGSIIRNSG